MVTKRFFLILLILAIFALGFAGCGVPKDQYAALQSQLSSVQKQYDDTKSKLDTALVDIEKMKGDAASQSAALNQARSSVDSLQKQVSDLQAKLADSTASNTALQKKASDLETRLNTILATKVTEYYKFSFQFITYDWTIPIPLKTYFAEKDLPRPSSYNALVSEPEAKSVMDTLSRLIKDAELANNLRKSDVVSLVGTFVRGLPHNDKDVTTAYDNYPRFPVETLIEQGGDSEDASILAASLLVQQGLNVVFLRFDQPKHVALGVNVSGISGYSWEYQGNRYYYMECSAKEWELGDAPLQFRSAKPTIVPVTP